MGNHIGKRLRAAVLSLLLAAGLLAGSLTGCTGKVYKAALEGSITGEKAPKGRYIEEEIPLPEELGQTRLINCLLKEDRSLEFYFRNKNQEILSYTYDKSGFKRRELPFQITEALSIEAVSHVLLGKDGNYYIGGMGKDFAYHLYKTEENGNLSQVYEKVFYVPEGKRFGLIPDFLAVLSDGSLLLSTESDAAIYSKDGNKEISFAQEAGKTDARTPVWASDHSYLTLLKDRIICYDMETGKESASYPIPNQVNKNKDDMALYENSGGSIYAAGQSGLYHIGKGGTIWEQIIDGALNSMGRPDISLKHFYPGGDQEYFGIYQKSQEGEMVFFRYAYDENVDTVPPNTLTIYSLRDSATVRQAASVLQKNNPKVRVDLRTGLENGEEKASEELLQALNTELLNGRGADVLILDGLPADLYRKKGILKDLNKIMEEMEPGLLTNLTEGFTFEDGKIYYLPARVRLPVVYGDDKAAAAFLSLEAMELYHGSGPLFAPDSYGNILRLTARTCYQELFEKSGILKEGALEKWLRAVKSAGEKSGFKKEYTAEELEQLVISNNKTEEGYGSQSAYSLSEGRSGAAAELLTCIENSLLTISAADMGGYELKDVNSTYIPAVMVGINASTAQEEAAEEFVKLLFDPDVQNKMLWDGFSVRPGILKQWAEEEKDIAVSSGMKGSDFYLKGSWPDRKRRDTIFSMVEAAKVPVIINESVMDLIAAGSKGYFDGKASLDETVQAIENQLELYRKGRE